MGIIKKIYSILYDRLMDYKILKINKRMENEKIIKYLNDKITKIFNEIFGYRIVIIEYKINLDESIYKDIKIDIETIYRR